jgi:tRNA(Ile)-lysidine synthase
LTVLSLSFATLNFIPKRIFIAFSGGLDSRVLFDLCYHDALIKKNNIELILVNVHHHTHPSEDSLSAFAVDIGKAYNTKVQILHVEPACPAGASLEAFMRTERYRLFDSLLIPGDILATGHHLNDQAETLLLNLLRGAGLQGLCAMPSLRPQGRAHLWRPLLAYSKEALLSYAQEHALVWQEDPGNQNLNFDRVFLREKIIPLLEQRWPKAGEVLFRTAHNMRNAQEILSHYLQHDLVSLHNDEGALNLAALKKFAPAQGLLLLKTYLDQHNYRLSQAQLKQIYQDFVCTDNDAAPLFEYQGGKLIRRKGFLYFSFFG